MIPAIVAAIAAWSGLLMLTVFWLRAHYQAPLTGMGLINSTTGTGAGNALGADPVVDPARRHPRQPVRDRRR